MTKEMQFRNVTIRFGFWEDAEGFSIDEGTWREWLYQTVKSWHHNPGPHYSVRTEVHTQTVLDDDEMKELISRVQEVDRPEA